jgi:SRSO17 transposase
MIIQKINNNKPESGSTATPDINSNAVTGPVDEKKLSSETKTKKTRKSKKIHVTPEIFDQLLKEVMAEFPQRWAEITGRKKE